MNEVHKLSLLVSVARNIRERSSGGDDLDRCACTNGRSLDENIVNGQCAYGGRKGQHIVVGVRVVDSRNGYTRSGVVEVRNVVRKVHQHHADAGTGALEVFLHLHLRSRSLDDRVYCKCVVGLGRLCEIVATERGTSGENVPDGRHVFQRHIIASRQSHLSLATIDVAQTTNSHGVLPHFVVVITCSHGFKQLLINGVVIRPRHPCLRF